MGERHGVVVCHTSLEEREDIVVLVPVVSHLPIVDVGLEIRVQLAAPDSLADACRVGKVKRRFAVPSHAVNPLIVIELRKHIHDADI